jgi:hypothetical protein
MSDQLIAGIVEDLQNTLPFHDKLPVTNRPQNALWAALNRTLLELRLPLHHDRLRKPRPKPAVYDQAVQSGLAILASFARQAGTQRAITPLRNGIAQKVSFQPRPFDANWTATHALHPPEFCDPKQDPMTRDDPRLPQVSIADMLHLARKVAVAFTRSRDDLRTIDGTATFEFMTNNLGQPSAWLVFRDFQRPHEPSVIEVLRHL